MPISRRTFFGQILGALTLGHGVAFASQSHRSAAPFPSHARFKFGPFRYAQFRVLAGPGDNNNSASTLGPVAAQIYEQALAFHASMSGEQRLANAVLQHDGEAGIRQSRHIVLTLHYEEGASAVFLSTVGTAFPESDVLRYQHATCEYRDDICHVTTETGEKWEINGRPAYPVPMAADSTHSDAAPIHQAFAKALA